MDKVYVDQAKTYKRSVAGKYLPSSGEEIISKVREAEFYLLSIKYDGHFYLLCYKNGEIAFVSPGGNIITDLPSLSIAKELLDKSGVKEAVIAGELYFKKEGRSRVFDLTANLDDKSPDISFAAFDILSLDENPISDLVDKYKKLDEIFPDGSKIHSVGSKKVESRKDIQDYFKQVVETDNHEGVIVKSSEGMIYKVKPRCTLDGVIIGYVEGEGDRLGMIREVLVAMINDEGNYQIVAKVGNGFTDDDRKSLNKSLSKLKTESNYIEGSGAKVAFTMVKPEMVVEYSSIDLVVETSKGPIRKMILSYTDKGYSAEQMSPSVSSMSPVFLRIRDDKKANKDDVRFSQITDMVEINTNIDSLELKKSEILDRKVFVKESKGQKMVRKFILIKTNKDNSPDYPAFVYHYTDFSPTRKAILKKEVKVSDSKKQIEQIFSDELAENVKKGWEPA